MASKYGKLAEDNVEENLHELKRGTLKSGSGQKVKSRKQAIAIGLSEARREGGKVPPEKSSSRKSTSRKSSLKTSKNSPSKKTAAEKTSSTKSTRKPSKKK